MKKSLYFYIVLCILFCYSLFTLKDNNKTFNIDGVKYAVTVDGAPGDNFPEKWSSGAWDVTVECENADGMWDYNKWAVVVSNITNNVSCNVAFVSKDLVRLNDYIKDELTGKTVGDGQVVNENGYRYEGANPNNYIMFNDELWRIIGVFDSAAHGQSGEYLTKIIRNQSIGALVWNSNNKNNWAASDLYYLLNGAYYNAEDGTNSGYCYKYAATNDKRTGVCDYRLKGIKEDYRNMIKSVTWYLGGYTNTAVTTPNIYSYERTTSTSTTYYYSGNAKTVTGNIGLIYLSDHGYSVLASSCPRTTNLSAYNTLACMGSSWLRDEMNTFTITHSTNISNAVFYLNANGSSFATAGTMGNLSTRPVLYLSSYVYILHGDGSITNPYIISM